MDGFMLVVWIIRILFLVLLYVFLARVARTLLRDLRAAAREQGSARGRVIVTASPSGEPEQGRSFDLDTITTLGRDVNNSIVIDDQFASFEHAVLTYRGRGWYIEDLGSTNGTFVNGRAVGSVLALGFGDEIAIGQVRLRLERGRTA
jgi:pSer/pThr/pTyr-binding forkhead associated (FHA) protein